MAFACVGELLMQCADAAVPGCQQLMRMLLSQLGRLYS